MYNEKEVIGRYQKYFDLWDQSASVRTKPNTYRFNRSQMSHALQNRHWFIRDGVPVLNHPLMQHIDAEKEQYLLGRFLLQFLEYGTLMEHEFINTMLAEMAMGECGIPIPDRMRLDAFKIYTDEAYHACFNMEATQQIRDYIGLPLSTAWPLKNSRLDGLRKVIPAGPSKENFLVRFGIACISETIAAKELSETMKGIVAEPIYNIFIDHAEDEKRHCMYFNTLFEVVWRNLSVNEQLFLGKSLPKILKAFVDINTISLADALQCIGISTEAAGIIIADSYPTDFSVKRALSVASVTFRMFARLGILDIPEIKNAFIEEGFLQYFAEAA